MKRSFSKRKIIFDLLLNIIAAAIPILFLQLLVLPRLAQHMTEERYGLLVTILALLNVVPATLGNSLNNLRLVNGSKEKDDGVKDYQIILSVCEGINLLVVGVVLLFYDRNATFFSWALTLIVAVFWLLREYYIVAFRIALNYVHITMSNVIMVLGYLVGYVFFLWIGQWQFIYIFGLFFSLLFIFLKSNLWKENFEKSSEFRSISVQMLLLTASGLLIRVTTYADKLLVFPILGGTAVSVYYTATLFGKIVSLVITPVSGVLLSYLSKEDSKNDTTFHMAFLSSAIVCVVGYFACISISRPVLGIIYPQFVDEAMKYVWITTGTLVLTALISILNPFILKFFDMKWQIVINAVYAIVYVSISVSLLNRYRLYGFCVGTMIAAALKLMSVVLIYTFCKEKNELIHSKAPE